MNNKETLIIGGWNFREKERGLHFFQGDKEVKCLWPETHIGTQVYDDKKKIDYISEEAEDTKTYGEGSGGFITALRLTDDKVLSRVRTYGIDTTHCALSKDGKYLIVVHHGGTSVDSSDKGGCPINLYALNEDGSIGECKDRIIIESGEKKSALHSVYCSPSGNFFIVNECGQDKVITLKIENEKMRITHTLDVENKYNPRYGVFHPTLPIYYGNNELVPVLSTYVYEEDGTIKKIKDLSMVVGNERETNNGIIPASDMVLHPSGKYIYVALRKVGRIVTVAIDENGDTKLVESVDCGGLFPRGLGVDKSGEHLYACNSDTGEVAELTIDKDGTIKDTGKRLAVKNAGNMIIVD